MPIHWETSKRRWCCTWPEIAGLEDAAQNAEDREQLGRASAIRAKIRPIQARIAAIVAARAVQS